MQIYYSSMTQTRQIFVNVYSSDDVALCENQFLTLFVSSCYIFALCVLLACGLYKQSCFYVD